MKYFIKFSFGGPESNDVMRDPKFGEKVQKYLQDVKAEAAYFTAIDGNRGGYIVVNMDDASQIPALAEPLFMWLGAEIEFIPLMLPEDLAKAGPSIETAIKQWG